MMTNGQRGSEKSASSPPPPKQTLPERLAHTAPVDRPGSAYPHAVALPN